MSIMGHRGGIHRGGVNPAKVALRDALRVYVWQHMSAFPEVWFSAPELARVIQERYVGGIKAPSVAGCHYGRSNAIAKVLEYLYARGEIEVRTRPHNGRYVAREWRWITR